MKGVEKLTGKKKQGENKLDIKENAVSELTKPENPKAVFGNVPKGPNSLVEVLQNKYTPYNNSFSGSNKNGKVGL